MGEGLGVSIRHRTAAAVVAAFLLGVGLVACSDDGSDEPPDSGLPSESELSPSDSEPTTEPTPTEPAGPVPPELPEAASRNNKAGAKAFVAYYLRLLTYAAHTGDVEPIRINSTSNCHACKEDARTWRSLYSRGGWAKGGELSITRLRAMAPAQPEDVYVGVAVARAKGTYKPRPDAKVETVPADVANLDYYLVRVPDGWRMARGEVAG